MKIDHVLDGLQEFYGETHTIVRPACRPQTELDAGMIYIEDVCEGIQGEDIVTYVCPICNKKHQSTAYRK